MLKMYRMLHALKIQNLFRNKKAIVFPEHLGLLHYYIFMLVLTVVRGTQVKKKKNCRWYSEQQF